MKRRLLCTGLLFCSWFGLGGSASARQEDWHWPERAKNLRELPADFPSRNLRAVMIGFTRALGVRCSHCHDGKPGEPLSSYDFASDNNPNKKTARVMLRMLKSINVQLKEITPTGPKRVNMWCHTCHRGRPRPLTLKEDLSEVLEAKGLDAALERYRALRDDYYGTSSYDFSESSLRDFASELLASGRSGDAIAFLRLNTEFFPKSAGSWRSLAAAYVETGQSELAVIHLQKSLELDPKNRDALEELRELQSRKP